MRELEYEVVDTTSGPDGPRTPRVGGRPPRGLFGALLLRGVLRTRFDPFFASLLEQDVHDANTNVKDADTTRPPREERRECRQRDGHAKGEADQGEGRREGSRVKGDCRGRRTKAHFSAFGARCSRATTSRAG